MGSRIIAIVIMIISLSGAGYYALQSQDRSQSLRAANAALRALKTNQGRTQNRISKLKRKQNMALERAKKNYVSKLSRERELRKKTKEKLKYLDAAFASLRATLAEEKSSALQNQTSLAKLRSALEEEKKSHEATIRQRSKERKQIKIKLETALQRKHDALKLLQEKVQEGKTDLADLRSSLEKEKKSREAIIKRGIEESKQFKIELNKNKTALQRERETLKQLKKKVREDKVALAREKKSALRRQADLDRLRSALTGTSSTAEENRQKLSVAKAMLAKMEESRKKIQKKALLLSTKVQSETSRAQKLERDVAILSQKLASQQVTLRQTKKMFQIDIIDHLLFDVGQTRIKEKGLATLNRIAAFLKKHPGRETRVEGHTDNLPISGVLARRYPTNWELSSARAIRVVRHLQSMGVSAERLSAAGRSFYSPVASNSSAIGRSKNRRIVIFMGRTKNVKKLR